MTSLIISALTAALWAGAGARRRALPAVDGFPNREMTPDSPQFLRALAEFGADQTQAVRLSRADSGKFLTSPIAPKPVPWAAPWLPDTLQKLGCWGPKAPSGCG